LNTHQKQQVVFIARTLRGGGVEKVLYELAHGLNRQLFDPTVIYLLDEKSLINYDPAIKTICLQDGVNEFIPPSPPIVNESVTSPSIPLVVDETVITPSIPPVKAQSEPKTRESLHALYNILPATIREKLHFRQRYQSISLKLSSTRQRTIRFLQNYYNFLAPSVREKIHIRQRLWSIWSMRRISKTANPVNSNSPQAQREVPSLYFVTPSYIPEIYDITNSISELWLQVLALRKVLERFSLDAILIPMDEYNTVLLWFSQLPPFRKVIASQHYPYSQAQPIRYPDEQVRRVKEWAYLNACRAADLVTFDSEGSRWDFIHNYGASPKRTISMPNLIHSDLILQKAREPLNVEIKHIDRKTIFTQVARLSLEKNPLLLVDACSVLIKKYNDFVVLYVGDGSLYPDMRKQINRKKLQNHILLLGEQANPYPYMAAARALLLTSRSESSPLVLVEAMLCGTVPISTDCVAGPRELLEDGKFGLLVPPGDPRAFAEAMYQIAVNDELYNRLRTGARDRALRFNSPRVIKEWEELILQVAENRIDYV
jgi:glycosyltransferase involved in cell wall biosynthesis